mmetsp:Transcript_65694/g.182871  ORF Transcript_65694/g.182871 Transcript_65694/m.182871 type:complete len:259 (-) Transcript_65694:442-1218(-)
MLKSVPHDFGLDIVEALPEEHLELRAMLEHLSLLLPQRSARLPLSFDHPFQALHRFAVSHLPLVLLVVRLLLLCLIDGALREVALALRMLRLRISRLRRLACRFTRGTGALLALRFEAHGLLPRKIELSVQSLTVVLALAQSVKELRIIRLKLLVFSVEILCKLLRLVELRDHAAVPRLKLSALVSLAHVLCLKVLGHLLQPGPESSHQLPLLVLQNFRSVVLDALDACDHRFVHILDDEHALLVLVMVRAFVQTALQ